MLWADGRSFHWCGGEDALGRPFTPQTLHPMYCCAKTVLAIVAANLVAGKDLSVDDVVGDLIQAPSPHASMTISELLSHRSGIIRPGMTETVIYPPRERLPAALGNKPITLGNDETAYSEAAASIVVAACLEAAADEPLESLVNDRILEPLGLGADFALAGQREDAAVSVSMVGGRRRPLLLERSRAFSFLENPGFGGFCTTHGLTTLALAFSNEVTGRGSPLSVGDVTARRFVTPQPIAFDKTFRRRCSFSLGFMSSLDTHHFPSGFSDQSIAQSGLTGMLTMIADPSRDLAATVLVNGFTGGRTLATELRHKIWAAILADVTADNGTVK